MDLSLCIALHLEMLFFALVVEFTLKQVVVVLLPVLTSCFCLHNLIVSLYLEVVHLQVFVRNDVVLASRGFADKLLFVFLILMSQK